MKEISIERLLEQFPLLDQIQHAHYLANRAARLEHAGMGRSVCEGRDGKVVWISPKEVFAQYGYDEFGRELPEERLEPEYYL